MILLIALAGGLGSAARFGVDALVRRSTPAELPWGTIAVNVTGSFLLGLLVGAGAELRWQLVLGTGFLGGYTTFSTASLETANLLLDRRPVAAVANGIGVMVLCVLAAAAGVDLAKL